MRKSLFLKGNDYVGDPMNIDDNPYYNYNIKLISPIYWVHNK